MQSRITVITACDRNYGQHTGIMLMSLFSSNKDILSRLDVYIITNDISEYDKEKITELGRHEGVPIFFKTVDLREIEGARVDGHVSIATYYRIFIPRLVPNEVSRVLYIDSDIIVVDRLLPLWEMDLSGKLIAAVQDSGLLLPKYVIKLGLPDDTHYFNAGVLLIDLDAWRRESVGTKLISMTVADPMKYKAWDQDVLNSLLWTRCLFIHPRYNLMRHFFKKNTSIYSDSEIKSAIKKPVLIHYNSSDKPWHIPCGHPLKSEYLKFKKLSPWKNVPRIRVGPGYVKMKILQYLPPSVALQLKKMKDAIFAPFRQSL